VVSVARISIAPVRGLGLEHPEFVDLADKGVLEDRRFYVIDEGGRLFDRLRFGPLVQVSAHTDPDAIRLRLAFPDGTVVEDEVRLGEPVETFIYKRIAAGRVVEGPWAEALSRFAGRAVRIVRCDEPGGTRRKNAISLISDGSLAELAKWVDVSAVDARRFRMLFEVEGAAAHEEDGWIGGRLAIGTAVVSITKPDARCAITTQDPDTGVPDMDTLRTLIAYRGLREGRKIDFGVLGEVVTPGRVSVGDEVEVLEREAGSDPTPRFERVLAARIS
jgi:uncharacterized protein